jgi:hypothetical protein
VRGSPWGAAATCREFAGFAAGARGTCRAAVSIIMERRLAWLSSAVVILNLLDAVFTMIYTQ